MPETEGGKSLADMTAEVKVLNIEKGWWDTPRSFGVDMALLHSEVSEAFEAYRKGEEVEAELADILIRLLDTCSRYGFDLERAYEWKMAVNRTRSYRHGGKTV